MASIPRYLGRMVIPKLVKKGFSRSGIVSYLRRTTGGWHYQTMLGDIRETQGIVRFGKAVKSLGGGVIPAKRIMVEADLSAARRYRVFGMGKYVNVETGFTKYKPVSFYANKLRTKDDWAELFKKEQPLTESDPEYLCEELDIFAIEHQEGWHY